MKASRTTKSRAAIAASLALMFPFFNATHAFGASQTYVIQTANFNASFGSGGGFHGFYNNSASEIGLYANGASDSSFAALESFSTTGVGSGPSRALQVGDSFSITAFISANPPSRIGISFLNSTGYTGFSNVDSNVEAKLQLNSSGGWNVLHAAGSNDSGLGAGADVTFTLTLTSSNSFNINVLRSGANFDVSDLRTSIGNPITSFGLFAVNSGNDTFWKNGSLSNTGNVALGATGSSSTTSTITGVIKDGLVANSASATSVNAVTKSGAGTVTLSGASSTYTGATAISSGVLKINNKDSLGSASAGTSVSAGAALMLQDNAGVALVGVPESITLTGNTASPFAGTDITGALRNISGGNSISGNVTLASQAAIASDANTLTLGNVINGGFRLIATGAGNITVGGSLTGSGDVLKQNAGTLRLASASAFGGGANNIFIDNGNVEASSTGALGTTDGLTTGLINIGPSTSTPSGGAGPMAVLITTGGVTVANPINARYFASISNNTKTVGGSNVAGLATFSGRVTLNDSLVVTAATGGSVTFTGNIVPGTATGGQALNGSPGITKTGGGVVSFNNALTYAGTTTIGGGTLLLNASHSGGGQYTVQSTAALGGNGTTNSAVSVQSGGAFSPGETGTDAIFTVNNNAFTLASGATFQVDISGVTAGTSFDQLKLTGSSTINLGGSTLQLLSGNNFFATSPPGFTPGLQFTIVKNSANQTIVNTFNNLAEGATLTAIGTKFTISYVGGGGHDIVLTTVPEPASAGLIVAAIGSLAMRRRRRGQTLDSRLMA